jgi:hypothetical protein
LFTKKVNFIIDYVIKNSLFVDTYHQSIYSKSILCPGPIEGKLLKRKAIFSANLRPKLGSKCHLEVVY